MSYTDADAALIESYGFTLWGSGVERDRQYWSGRNGNLFLYQPNDPDLTDQNPPGQWNLSRVASDLDLFFDTAAQALAWAALNGYLA